jgi:hypothetical protein
MAGAWADFAAGLALVKEGGLTLLIQHASPGTENQANWLPAPEGPFSMIMRLYWPEVAALEGSWKAPPLQQESTEAMLANR